MSDLVRVARVGKQTVRVPAAIDGHAVTGFAEARETASGSVDALLQLKNGGKVWANTGDKGRTWQSYAEAGGTA